MHAQPKPEPIDPAYLSPRTEFVVMPLEVDMEIQDTRLALDALAWIFQDSADMNVALSKAGSCTRLLQVPQESMAALMRTLSEKLKPAHDLPCLQKMRDVRPDLFKAK